MKLFALFRNELGFSQEQAEGAAGVLLKLAQARLSQNEFQAVADTIPAVSDVIGKAPRFEVPPRSRLKARLSRMLGGLGELAPLAEPLRRLQIEKRLVPRCAEVIQLYVDEVGNPEASATLRQVWR